MPYVTTTYKRNELYEQVWARPVSEVAKDYGVSDTALAKVCKKLRVPRPLRGHWAKKKAGLDTLQVVLPPLRQGEQETYEITKFVYPSPPPDEVPRAKVAPLPATTLSVSPALSKPHPFVAETKKGSSAPKHLQNGLFWAAGPLNINVSPQSFDRALRILDCLLKAIEEGGHRVLPAEERDRARAQINGEEIRIYVTERLRRVDHVPDKGRDFIYAPKWDLVPTGDLRIGITWDPGYGGEHRWQETTKRRMESFVGEVLAKMIWAAADRKARVEQREERARRQREAEIQQYKLEAQRREEQQRAESLIQDSTKWEQADRLRRYIAAVESEAERRQVPTQSGSRAAQWIAWAKGVAARLDPMDDLFAPRDKTGG